MYSIAVGDSINSQSAAAGFRVLEDRLSRRDAGVDQSFLLAIH
jgi:hypothetical protein